MACFMLQSLNPVMSCKVAKVFPKRFWIIWRGLTLFAPVANGDLDRPLSRIVTILTELPRLQECRCMELIISCSYVCRRI